MSEQKYKLGFVMEQTLGHVTHYKNLLAHAATDPEVEPVWLPITFDNLMGRLPLIGSNWSVRASLHARKLASAAVREHDLSALFFHTQVTSLFSVSLMQRVPTIISLDATPLNYDTVGAYYGHKSDLGNPLEKLKQAINRRAYHAARLLVTWCQWAKDSLVTDYQVPAERIHVLAPGVDLTLWGTDKRAAIQMAPEKVKILFVGADFVRKGGPLLLEVFRTRFRSTAELHLITKEVLPSEPGVYVYNNLGPNHPTLRRLFHEADLFVFPTLADCSPIAISEAMAAGLPVITTNIGAIPEMVEDGYNGFTVSPADGTALQQRIHRLISDSDLRHTMGQRGRSRVEDRFDARKNNAAVLALLKSVANHPQHLPGELSESFNRAEMSEANQAI